MRGARAEDGWECVARAIGVAAPRLLRVRQVHGTACACVNGPGSIWPSDERPEADAMIATRTDVALAVQMADCVPVLMADCQRRAVAAVHAGWRGAAAAIVESVVHRLRSEQRVDPANLVAAVGPSIGPCCYEVGQAVRERFHARLGEAVDRWFVPGSRGSSRPHLDLWNATRDQLISAGIPAEQIFVAALCTACHLDIFHSYRKEGDRTGRMVGVIRRI
ncbi:MAG: peptidoglycan editing factor PgeF [Acidobacteria bacterium]|nr:peptidoglycan editing factor PgeF [Acidobacteriota bacterium]MBI3264172.1 peptidoglycan editing factor PgeF [Acidobacteriota bacterium]